MPVRCDRIRIRGPGPEDDELQRLRRCLGPEKQRRGGDGNHERAADASAQMNQEAHITGSVEAFAQVLLVRH